MKKIFSLTSPQREIWFDQILHDSISLYNRARIIKLSGAINPDLFEKAVNVLIKQHDALQLTMEEGETGIPQQYYALAPSITVPLWDFSDKKQAETFANQWMLARSNEAFTLTKNLLFRVDLIKVEHGCYYALMQYHHLITDGFSNTLLTQSLASIYTQLVDSKVPNLNRYSYHDFIEFDASQSLETQRAYWLKKYTSAPKPLFNPRYHLNSNDDFIGSELTSFTLPRILYQQLHQLGKHNQTTFFRVLLAVFYVYFTRTQQRDDFAIGVPTLNRSQANFKKTAGLFTLINPAWFEFGQTLNFQELLQKIDHSLKEDFAHQPFPSSEISRVVNQGDHNASLFDISISYLRFDSEAVFADIESETTLLPNLWEQSPLSIYVQDFHQDGDVTFDFIYNLRYFNANDINTLQARLLVLLETVIDNNQLPISALPLMTVAETTQIQAWNKTDKNFPEGDHVVPLFEQQVKKAPNKIALVFEEKSLTYQQLNQQANQLAHYLKALTTPENEALIQGNAFIAISVERSLTLIIGLLAILKMGAAYVPIDPHYPNDRIAHMFTDSKAPVLLTQTHLQAQLSTDELACEVIYLDTDIYADSSTENIKTTLNKRDLAYVIYTSGSTGKPKGVMIEHLALSNFIHSSIERYEINAKDRLLQFASVSFDAAIEEIYTTLLQGATLVLRTDEMISSSENFLSQCRQQKITVLDLPTAYWQNLLTDIDILKKTWPESVRLVIIGGEAVSAHSIGVWLDHFGDYPVLLNTYGPTETTVVASVFQFQSGENPKIYIGQPILNTGIYILDTKQRLLPPETVGELCISGAGLARGYLNRPELTTEKFMTVDILGKMTRIYRTGDLAQWSAHGQLDYLGRIDHQVKLRGFRIELGEIEQRLCLYAAVKEAVVLLHEKEQNKRLIAYITVDKTQKPSIRDLQDWLKKTLPNYMLPAQIIFLDTLTMTSNGKVDKQALPAPDSLGILQSEMLQTSPLETLTEEILVQIWVELLGLDSLTGSSLNRDDDFFAMGGHSLIAVQLIAQLQKIFQVKLPLVCLFENPTIASLAHCIDDYKQTVIEQNKPWSPLVPFQLSGTKSPIFIIPGGAAAEGELMNLVKLVYLLGKDRPVYGLRARGWDEEQPPYESVETMAADFIKAIQHIQSQGAYLLVGECLGGRVMLEVAQQLAQQGETIEGLFLIEPPLHDGHANVWSLIKYIILPRLKNQWGQLKGLSIDQWGSYLLGKMGRFKRLLWLEAVDASPTEIASDETIERQQEVHQNRILSHQPPIHAGDLTLLITKRLRDNPPTFGWEALATGRVTLMELPSNDEHTAYLGDDVDATAEHLKTCLAAL
ncbi:MAG: amino acid adenylation domain-containing protein [Methylococcales bacterium]|nr:amino acid adenylation domain-containing protein [Methylococcales bacterium]